MDGDSPPLYPFRAETGLGQRIAPDLSIQMMWVCRILVNLTSSSRRPRVPVEGGGAAGSG